MEKKLKINTMNQSDCNAISEIDESKKVSKKSTISEIKEQVIENGEKKRPWDIFRANHGLRALSGLCFFSQNVWHMIS